jgi:antibiotic biosynthesis monooxygenase (ABM) superfamily enzyme
MAQLPQRIGLRKSNLSDSTNCLTHENKSNITRPINKHVMALISFLALLPLVYFIPDIVGQFLPDIKWLNVTVAVGVIVPIMSYIIMPTAYLVLSRELNRRGNTKHPS